MSPDVALDLPRMRHMSVGMTAYAEELALRLPRVAPDLSFATFVRASALDAREQIALPLRMGASRARLAHYLSVYAPALAPQPYVITIHDLIHLRFPQYFKWNVGPYYRLIVRTACARAARVVTDDEKTLADLERYLDVSPRKVRVVPLGVDEAFAHVVPALENGRPYFVYAGNHRPHKDLATLYAAWERLPDDLAFDLVLTGNGATDPAPRPTRAHGTIRFLGDLSRPDLARAYVGAVALVYPSLCEGFGLPMVEAAAAGTSVIACADAVPTVLRPHVTLFPARDVAALATAMEDAARRPAAQPAARELARSLTWDRCAAATAEVYREVLAESKRR